jgi:hypothetical protein
MINITYCDKCIFVALEEFSLVPGRFGHHALRYYGPRREVLSLHWACERAGNARRADIPGSMAWS